MKFSLELLFALGLCLLQGVVAPEPPSCTDTPPNVGETCNEDLCDIYGPYICLNTCDRCG